MESVPDELLMAYADDALTPAEKDQVAAILERDPKLREKVEEYVAARAALSEIFGPIAEKPVPPHLEAMVRRATPPTSTAGPGRLSRLKAFAEHVGAIADPKKLSLVPVAALIAAGIVVGSLFAVMHRIGEPTSDEARLINTDDKGQYAAGELAVALDATPSGRSTGRQASITPILSFRSLGGQYCRQYSVQSASAGRIAGVACREHTSGRAQGLWRVISQEQLQQAAGSNGFRPASGPDVPSIEAAVNRLIVGDVIGPDREADLIREGWNPSP